MSKRYKKPPKHLGKPIVFQTDIYQVGLGSPWYFSIRIKVTGQTVANAGGFGSRQWAGRAARAVLSALEEKHGAGK